MENLYGSSRVSKLSPRQLIKGGSFENLDLGDSPLLRYLHGRSQSPVGGGFKQRRHPLSPVENLIAAAAARSPPPPYRTPVRAALSEEVFVMDGVLVTDGKRSSSRSGGSSGSPSSASSDSSGKSTLYKGQFVIGKENLRPTRFPGKNKSELCKSTPSSGSCTPSLKSRLVYQIMASAVSEAAAAASSPKLKCTSKTPTPVICCGDWSPQDDGIEVVLPSSTEKPTSKVDVDEYITASLYGPTTRRRLSVFADICPE